MTPPPPPLIIEKDGWRLLFNEPCEQGCISLENGGGRISMLLNESELMDLCAATFAARRRIRRNRRS